MLDRVVVIGNEAAPRHAYEVFATDREQMTHVIKANSFVWYLVDNRSDSHANSYNFNRDSHWFWQSLIGGCPNFVRRCRFNSVKNLDATPLFFHKSRGDPSSALSRARSSSLRLHPWRLESGASSTFSQLVCYLFVLHLISGVIFREPVLTIFIIITSFL